MRLRNIKGADEKIATSEYVIQNPAEWKNKWNEYFNNGKPVHIEIGMGKGRFMMDMAALHPDINYIGIEKFDSVLARSLPKIPEGVKNLMIIRMDALNIEKVFDKEIDRIYLNFSDPWPKDRHAKRRLTSRQFLARYDEFLKKEGTVEFKTDNRDLFDFSVEETKEAGWNIEQITYDLHNSEMNEGNVMTEYEIRFSSEGTPINKMIIGR